jgi:hypothetical protein
MSRAAIRGIAAIRVMVRILGRLRIAGVEGDDIV